jgi:hypothetical protein
MLDAKDARRKNAMMHEPRMLSLSILSLSTLEIATATKSECD